MPRISGRAAFLQILADEGVSHLFGNPGTTELPIMEVLPDHPQLQFVLGLQESVVLGMADGYARASGRLTAANVHVAPGLGNAMGALYNAKFSNSPIIVTAGQQEQGHGLLEPLLYDPLVPIAQPLVKWAVEPTRVEDLPRIVRRAAKVAMTPPTGPVFISLPGDVLDAEADLDLGRSVRIDSATRPSGRDARQACRHAARGTRTGDRRRPRARHARRLRRGRRARRTARRGRARRSRCPTARSSRPRIPRTSAR